MPGAPPFASTRLSAASKFSRPITCSHTLPPPALDAPSSRAGDGSALRSSPGASPLSLVLEYPYPGKAAFCVRPANDSRSRPLSTFRPSHCDGSGTMASADSCSLSPTSRLELPSQTAWQQVSPGKCVDFPCTLAPFTALALDCIGLRCLLPTRPASQPPMGFAFLKSQVCFRLPSDPTSR